MRPRKRILCINSNETELGLLSYLLETMAYRAIKAATPAQAEALFAAEGEVDGSGPDLVICAAVDVPYDAFRLVRRLKRISPHVPVILLGTREMVYEGTHPADSMLVAQYLEASRLLEFVKVMATRKRGPRVGSTHRIPPQSVIPPAVAAAAGVR